MIFTMIGFILLIVVGAIVWFAWDQVVSAIYTTVSTTFPTYFTDSWVTFLNSMWTWMLLIVVLFGGLLWVYTQSQKPRSPYE